MLLLNMVMRHISPAYRGHPPDFFAPRLEQETSHMGRTIRWTWSDEPDWSVEVCRECDFTTGEQCQPCKDYITRHRTKEDE